MANTPNVPNNTTGTAIAGIKVARIFCRKMYITITTSKMASISVFTTSSTETLIKSVLSLIRDFVSVRQQFKLGSLGLYPLGGCQCISTRCQHHRDPRGWMAVQAGRHAVIFIAQLNTGHIAQSYHRARAVTLTIILLNCSGVFRRDCAMTVAVNCCSLPLGNAPILPAETCVFCAVMAD